VSTSYWHLPTWRTRFRVRRRWCRLRGHRPFTDDGFLVCAVCYQSLTPNGLALGYRIDR
jgi:hypothetical protein